MLCNKNIEEIIDIREKTYSYLHKVNVYKMIGFILAAVVTAYISSVKFEELKFDANREMLFMVAIFTIPTIFLIFGFLYFLEDTSYEISRESSENYIRFTYELTSKIIEEKQMK